MIKPHPPGFSCSPAYNTFKSGQIFPIASNLEKSIPLCAAQLWKFSGQVVKRQLDRLFQLQLAGQLSRQRQQLGRREVGIGGQGIAKLADSP